MTLKDTAQGYSWLSILFHWLTAVTVISLWLIAEIAHDAPKEEGYRLMGLHISIAMSLYLVLWARILWRAFNRRPTAAPQHRLLGLLATWVPVVLLAGIALMLVSGPMLVWSSGNPINIFDLVALPSPIGESEDLHEWMEEVHELGANLLYFGVIIHVLGGLKHLVIDRDGTLRRMLVPGNR
ncbi:MAG: cytochrome b [Porticoccaceae bacterium]|jgi:cytochrome b561|nr:cytochrome b [Porticoccaceae bacterium]MEA3299130.1 cytochrome b [Pseudomonadota bacterium]HLS97582.1 cytochrome b [Porticoccaceae bacterium]